MNILKIALATSVALGLASGAEAQDGRFAAAFGGPSAMPSPDGLLTGAVTYVDPRGGIKGADADGEVGLSYSFGSAVRNVSVTVGAAITGTKPFGDAGSFSLSANRLAYAAPSSLTFVGATVSGLGKWGSIKGKGDPKWSAAVTNTGAVGTAEIPYTVSVGYGQENTWNKNKTGKLEDGASWAVGVGVIPAVSLGLSGTATQVNSGVVIGLPFAPGVSISAGQYDVGNRVNRRQNSITIGYGIDTKGLFK